MAGDVDVNSGMFAGDTARRTGRWRSDEQVHGGSAARAARWWRGRWTWRGRGREHLGVLGDLGPRRNTVVAGGDAGGDTLNAEPGAATLSSTLDVAGNVT